MGGQTSKAEPCIPWQFMPPEVLGEIFDYLDKKDLLWARQTCHHWNNVSLMDQFWTERTFTLRAQDQHEDDIEGWQISKYMEKFGAHLQHLTVTLEIDGSRRNPEAESSKISALKQLFLNTEQLRSFSCKNFCDLHDTLEIHNKTKRAAILAPLNRLLERQERLCVVAFIDPYLDLDEGCNVLRALATHGSLTVTSMTLRNFFDGGVEFVDECPEYLQLMGRFRMLEGVGLSFNFLTNAVLTKLTSASPALRRILLYVDELNIGDTNPPSMQPDWQFAVTKSSELSVWVMIENGDDVYDILLPKMPVVGLSLNMIVYREEMTYEQFRSAIANVTRCIGDHRLKTFIFRQQVDGTPEQPRSVRGPFRHADTLVDLVHACPSLTTLCLQVTLTLDSLLQLAAAARAQGGQEGEERGPSVTHAAPGILRLQIHIEGCETVLDKSALEGAVFGVNPLCTVRLCKGCEPVLTKPAFI